MTGRWASGPPPPLVRSTHHARTGLRPDIRTCSRGRCSAGVNPVPHRTAAGVLGIEALEAVALEGRTDGGSDRTSSAVRPAGPGGQSDGARRRIGGVSPGPGDNPGDRRWVSAGDCARAGLPPRVRTPVPCGASRTGLVLISDKGFAGRDIEQLLAERQIALLRPEGQKTLVMTHCPGSASQVGGRSSSRGAGIGIHVAGGIRLNSRQAAEAAVNRVTPVGRAGARNRGVGTGRLGLVPVDSH